ncbi:flavin-containing monooxygenase [Streptomyces canus]|uniref:flavin-containing monooxygenase n=1 Tax=Streptomyces canus TaxID=58343 RepID=UPI00371E08D1
MTTTTSSEKMEVKLDFTGSANVDVDAVIVGGGLSGIRALIEMRRLGLRARLIEAGSDVGGTWYWNRYPGARTDSQAWVYGFPLDEVRFNWRWAERFATQPQTHGYLKYVTDTFDLWPDIKFDTRVESAVFDEGTGTWMVSTDKGDEISARFFVAATGQLSLPYLPNFDGLSEFEGEWYQTQKWPEGGVNFDGKRVAIVGTGATGIQVIPIVASEAAHLTVFQRTPNYVLPARNDALSDHDVSIIRKNSDEIFDRAFSQAFGMDIPISAGRVAADCTPEEQQQVLERGWEYGGFRYLFETFDDILTDEQSNELAADFVRNKIRSIVKDPATAELLCPKGYPLGNKRPPLGHYYYETFNKENVSLADISETPMRIEPKGIRVGNELHEVDAIIFSTGYDALTGTLNQIDIRGRGGAMLRERWTNGPRTHLGMLVDGFPNFFMVAGPQTPFANIPVVTESCVNWLRDMLTAMHERGCDTVEPTPESVEQFRQTVEAVTDMTVFRRGGVRNWFLGTNIPGKPEATVMWLGGVASFRNVCEAEASADYKGLVFTSSDASRR